MKQEISILVISPNIILYNTVLDASYAIGDSIVVYRTLNVAEALQMMKNLELRSDKLQIYLDSKASKSEAQRFLHVLDREYSSRSRRMVILADDASNTSSIVSLAIAECVGDVLNYPISSAEVDTAIQKQFPKLRTYIHS
ncbi:MAG: hypothetical protein WBG42_07315 [Cryomorphaceae bacterium]